MSTSTVVTRSRAEGRASEGALAEVAAEALTELVFGLAESTRVRLGAAEDTAPAVLEALASDSSVTVRAAVAMNVATPMEAVRLLASDSDERVRTLLGRKLATLLPSASQHDRSAMAGQALAMLSGMIEDEAVRVRAAIADVLKAMPDAPKSLILKLAHDSAVPVCDPVIRLSPLLGTEDLLALVAKAPSVGTATAVASRPGLHERVADAIATGNDPAAIAAQLRNRSAAIREATLDALAARAAPHPDWHEPLVHRPTLSARAARALSEIVTTQLLQDLASRADLDEELTRTLHRRLAERLAPPPAPPASADRSAEDALSLAHAMLSDNRLDEAAIMAAAERGEVRLCTAMLALAARVPVPVVERAATLRSAKGLVSLVARAGFSMRCAVALQALLGRLPPALVLQPTPDGGFPLGLEEMRWQVDFLLQVGR
jgi:uncharacterized protein (DUF2336 family)